ncbi:hypothetical protein [Pleomorphomonas koreensis]|uniref:hypothetical protein n=1 Tax=Pleomorphomonas koreensis TaxID=257440 RepID=UPI000479C3B5|nr:hypothetical protein [Pleomorphomonas koreensis]
MTNRIPPRSVLFRRATASARETLAKDLFSPDKVLEAAAQAAALGECFIVLTPPRPIDLRGTETASELLAILKKEGFEFSWDRREHPTNVELPPTFNLLIRWDNDPKIKE